MCSVVTVEPISDGERAEQKRKHIMDGALQHLKPFYVSSVPTCWGIRMKKNIEWLRCPAWNTEPVTGDDANTDWSTQERQFTVLQENKAEAFKSLSFQHWCSFWNICVWVFISSQALSYIYPPDRRLWLCSSCMQSTKFSQSVAFFCWFFFENKVEYILYRMGEPILW